MMGWEESYRRDNGVQDKEPTAAEKQAAYAARFRAWNQQHTRNTKDIIKEERGE
ncbi:MAG: hypothetical protein AB7H77_09615 [Bdellovibrionales bacterium]